mmetsp:Transcript_95533/g.151142  ORF Transcript_95533/g.151142 Transcript_95533/m.151142 type:complete len:193 (-) Transcript_95533:55-633(-)
MKNMFSALVIVLSAVGAKGALLRSQSSTAQEPDTSCGKGFDNLVGGSQEYYNTASIKLWAHPYHAADNATFAKEFKCWFALMNTMKCDGLPSQADARKDKLTKACLAHDTEWYPIWKMFSDAEVKFFKDNYPAVPIEGDKVVVVDNEYKSAGINYKQAMTTAKEVNKKELLCLTLFTIDDECVKWPYIRLGK